MNERRYSEEEIAEIFARATEAQKHTLPGASAEPADGLTLEELQEVGREVGLPPELVAHAARSLDMAPRAHGRTMLGVPVGVGRTAELPRPLTETEWHRLVADLRETFDARGRLSDQGPFKQWTNGNLQALLEPSQDGQRLRLRTLKGSAMSSMGIGLAMTAISAIVLVSTVVAGGALDASFWTLLLTGVALLFVGAAQVPGWARTRQRQMEEVIERVRLMVATEPPTTSTELDPR